jgi:hypothetical protein
MERKAVSTSADRQRRYFAKKKKLWGSGKGNFKTVGNYGSAGVRG